MRKYYCVRNTGGSGVYRDKLTKGNTAKGDEDQVMTSTKEK